MADGFEITSNLIPYCSPDLTRFQLRFGYVLVLSLTIPANCELYFVDDGMLIIDEGGSLIINQNATILRYRRR